MSKSARDYSMEQMYYSMFVSYIIPYFVFIFVNSIM